MKFTPQDIHNIRMAQTVATAVSLSVENRVPAASLKAEDINTHFDKTVKQLFEGDELLAYTTIVIEMSHCYQHGLELQLDSEACRLLKYAIMRTLSHVGYATDKRVEFQNLMRDSMGEPLSYRRQVVTEIGMYVAHNLMEPKALSQFRRTFIKLTEGGLDA